MTQVYDRKTGNVLFEGISGEAVEWRIAHEWDYDYIHCDLAIRDV